MSRRPSRRSFLVAAGASSVALAGCTGLGDVSVPGGGGGNATSDGADSANGPEDSSRDGPVLEPYTGGTVVEDFEDLEPWGTIGEGSITADTDVVYVGSQSARLENADGGAAGMFKAYPDGLDLSTDNLSIAVKLEEPAAGRLSVEYLAPGRANHLVTHRYIPEEMGSWFRADLGYTGKTGDPDIDNVQELRIMVLTDGEPIRFWVDDLQATPKPDKGKYILSFDDAHVSHYDVAFQELQNRGWPGVAAVVPNVIGSQNALTTGQLREMRDAGWDVSSHPQPDRGLPSYPIEQQRSIMEEAKDYLEKKGFSEGARFFFAPFNSFDSEMLEVVSDLHEYGFTFGACPGGAPPTGKYTISRVLGRDPQGIRRVLNLAEEYKQLVVINWHSIGPNANTGLDDFMNAVEHIEEKDADVISPSQLLEMDERQR